MTGRVSDVAVGFPGLRRTIREGTFPTAASPSSTSFTLLLGLGALGSAMAACDGGAAPGRGRKSAGYLREQYRCLERREIQAELCSASGSSGRAVRGSW